ncbi:MAG TPA: helix-turn-helix domain-containing protein [Ktedonobacteraceae bacterium]
MRAYSQDVRQQVLHAVDEGISRMQIIDLFQVSRATIKRYLKQRRETGTVLPRPIPGRPSKKGAALQMGMQALLEVHPDARQEDYCQWWEDEHGMRVSRASMSRAIHALGWVRKAGRRTNQNVP